MKPFHTIAVPHKDILEGRVTMDVFAADLWAVFQDRGPDDYKDPDLFFRRTFLTKGLKNLFGVLEKRIRGEGGDAVIQLKTPFGGGKTHAMIGIYHRANKWKAKRIVIVGTELNPQKYTIWGLIEEQLTGYIKKFTANISPGKEDLRKLLEENQPILILMDEILEYVTKAAGIKVGDTSLASQTIAFMQELTEVVSTLEKTCLIITLPTSIIEHYDESAELLFQRLQKVTGRVEKIYTPVDDDEISSVVRKRLFSELNENEIKDVVLEVIDYFKKENILPLGVEPSEYKNKFIMSFPFLPDVIECFYYRWGSFPTFQRTRGVLRLLSLVIYDLKDTNIGYISLANFKLDNHELRTELLKHIGNEFNSVIAADITGKNSGSKIIDKSLGESYRGIQLGTRSSTIIFLNSFSGGPEKGVTIGDIKRSATTISISSSIVLEAIDKLKEKLFYLQYRADKYFFTNQPNLNKILLNKMENIDERDVINVEKEGILALSKSRKLKTYVWPSQSSEIPEDSQLKLIILRRKEEDLIKQIIETKGSTPRVYRNVLFFLIPVDIKIQSLKTSIKRKLAYEQLEKDETLKLTETQKKDVKNSIKKENRNIPYKIKEVYRTILIPAKDEIRSLDLGIPTFGDKTNISEQVFSKLKSEGIIIENIAPIVLKEKYLKEKQYVRVNQIYDTPLKTLGETILISKPSLEKSIKEGVKKGLFGFGTLEGNGIQVLSWKNTPTIKFEDYEILIEASICGKEAGIKEPEIQGVIKPPRPEIEPEKEEEAKIEPTQESVTKLKPITKLDLRSFIIPKGKVRDILRLINYLQTKFEIVEIKIKAKDGEMTKEEFEDKIKEGLKQLNIDI